MHAWETNEPMFELNRTPMLLLQSILLATESDCDRSVAHNRRRPNHSIEAEKFSSTTDACLTAKGEN